MDEDGKSDAVGPQRKLGTILFSPVFQLRFVLLEESAQVPRIRMKE